MANLPRPIYGTHKGRRFRLLQQETFNLDFSILKPTGVYVIQYLDDYSTVEVSVFSHDITFDPVEFEPEEMKEESRVMEESTLHNLTIYYKSDNIGEIKITGTEVSWLMDRLFERTSGYFQNFTDLRTGKTVIVNLMEIESIEIEEV